MTAIRPICSLVIILLTCQQTAHAYLYAPNIKANSIVEISKDWDLKGKCVVLPEGVTLKFINTKIYNGTLQGNQTKIAGNDNAIFDMITISGTWNVPVISTNMFVNLNYDNSLRDVLALTNSYIYNKVTIEKGDYYFDLNSSAKTGVIVESNTNLIINGNLRLKSNSLRSYDIVRVTGWDITITGDGTIIGDLSTHIDKGGEWGMGIYLKGATNVSISGISIQNCWGDCVYIGGKSQNIIVNNCTLEYGRRQGVSVTYGSNVTLRNLKITNIGGTSPGYGIDIEPNSNGIVEDVYIKDVIIDNSVGGILVYGRAKGAKIENIIIENCQIYYTTKFPFNVRRCESVQFKGDIFTKKI